MKIPTHADAFEVLCLQAADNGRGEVLFGDCLARARNVGRPFMIGEKFPDVYLEFPLIGEPFLDVTTLYNSIELNAYVESDAAKGTEPLIDWFTHECRDTEGVCLGFELDVKDPLLPQAAIHFQPRTHLELIKPFFEAAGEPERGELYLDLALRMPKGWPLSFFGMFRGRPDSPLRICGYLGSDEKQTCIDDPAHIASAFDTIGFSAYDDAMLMRISELMAVAPGTVDFQFDIYDDGHIGNIFAIDAQFEIAQPEGVRASFADGPAARVLGLLENWHVADERWRIVADAAFARSLDVELEEGASSRYAFTLMPQWVKVRWNDKALQPSKLYHLAHAGLLDDQEQA